MAFCQRVLSLLLMCRSSLIISSRFNSKPLMSTSTLLSSVGVADSSTMTDGFSPRNVSCAISLYALCPSSKMIIGERIRSVLPSEVFTCR